MHFGVLLWHRPWRQHNRKVPPISAQDQLPHLNQEQEESEVGGDGEADVDLDGLHLVGRNHPGGHGHLAAVDCPEDGEEKEGEDDVDPDLHTEPELIVQLEQGLEEVELDEDEEDDHGDRAADSQEESQCVEEEPEDGSCCGGGNKPGEKYREQSECLSTSPVQICKFCFDVSKLNI